MWAGEDPLDFRCQRGREEKRLPSERCQAEDPLDIGNEPHIQHPVGLIDDHDLDAGQQKLAAFEVIQQPPRCGNQDVDALVDQHILLFERHAADQKRLRQLDVL
eukprot:TRINITY_DN8314_c1_g1_i1.p2 TRINITY_DN8314_c1_g1~~TRINITY_DN8314_c1_g1_i1.p2  ORF type:complete len:104 (+),score=17.04 TRINITY_DN8314_c1_g1_i1:61-372(+)